MKTAPPSGKVPGPAQEGLGLSSRASILLLFAGLSLAGTAKGGPEEPPNVIITGDTMHIIDQGRSVRFMGHVRMTRGEEVLTSEELLSDKERHLLHAKGNVRVEKPGTGPHTWEARGDEGTYDTERSSYTLWSHGAKATVVRTLPGPPQKSIHLEARWMTSDSGFSYALARGDVFGLWESTSSAQRIRFWAEEATYEGQRGLLTLTGSRPILILTQPTDARRVTGELIRYHVDSQVLEVEGEAVSMLLPRGKTP